MREMSQNTELENLINPDIPDGDLDKEKHSSQCLAKVKGFVGVMASILSAVVSYTSVQLLERAIPDFELNSIRFGLASICILPILLIKRIPVLIPRDQIQGTIGYGIFVFGEIGTTYVAVTYIPVSHLDAIKLTAAVSSGLILFSVLWEEKLTVSKISFALLGVCGLICVTQPDFIFHSHHLTSNSSTGDNTYKGEKVNNHNDSSNPNSTGAIAIKDYYIKPNAATLIMAYCLSAAAGISISSLTLVFKHRPYIGQNILQVSFWLFACGAIVSTIVMAFVEVPISPKTWKEMLLICVHSVTCVTNTTSYCIGIRYLSANTANILSCTQVVFMLIPQYTILSSIYPGHRNWIEVVGIILVLLGSSFVSVQEMAS